jgi:thiol-disulfide isomerase/thioredoxin
MNKQLLKESIKRKEKSLLFFNAPWCPVCVEMRPIIEQIKNSKPDYTFYDLNADDKITKDLEQALQEYEIRLQFLSRGCIVHVGCKAIAFETVESAMKEVNEYVKNTYETQKKWRKLLDTQENY